MGSEGQDRRKLLAAQRVAARREELAKVAKPFDRFRPQLRTGQDLRRIGPELPVIAARRSPLYMHMLEIQQWPNEWFMVWRFNRVRRARQVVEEIVAGTREVPKGEYEIEVRAIPHPNGTGWEAIGEIAAMYVGGRGREEWEEEWRMLHP